MGRLYRSLFYSLLFLLTFAAFPAAAELSVDNYQLVGSQRVNRVLFDYTYTADVTNSGAALQNVTATLTSNSPNTTVIDNELSFGDVGENATVTSSNTFTIRQDRRFPFDPTALVWAPSGEPVQQIPVVAIPIETDPDAFFTNTQTQVRVLAQILPQAGLDSSSATLYEVDDNLNPLGASLCSLLDNGNLGNGDDIAGDSVFSCFVTLNKASPTQIHLAAQVLINGEINSSPAVILEVVDPLTNEQAQTVVDTQAAAAQIWQSQLALLGDTLGARLAAAEEIRLLTGVADAGVSSDDTTIWILYNSGLKGGLMLNPDGTRGGSGERVSNTPPVAPEDARDPVSFSPSTSPLVSALNGGSNTTLFTLATIAENTPIENTNVLIWDAYNHQFAPFDEGPDLQTLFQNSQCPKFNVAYLKDTQATVDSVRTFTQYGTVILVTHGGVDGDGQVVFLTDENANLFNILSHAIDLILGRVTVMGNVFAIRPSFISSLSGSMQNTLVYNGSCQSSANNTMSSAFIGKGAKTYYGYTRVVNSNFAQNVSNQLFNNLVVNLNNTGEAFSPVTPKVDPTTPFATFTQSGDNMLAYTGELVNGGFEKGDLTGWTRLGDGRVIATLGSYTPPEGTFMGIISTGLGFTTSSGSIAQNFCLPKTATQLKFDWNFSSEEFIEWCGAQHPYDDPFQVELTTDTGTTVLLHETIDTLCSSVSPTSLAFDQSGPGCTPSDGVGLGTGGQDCTVWSTGWRSSTIDISGLATTNNGKGVTLRFRNFDAGDSIFDSAVLIDKVEVVTP
jgi:hypothetical protein